MVMSFLKKNQMLLYVIALMLVVAGYLNYTSLEHDVNSTIQTSTNVEEMNETKNIGDAQLVNSNVVTTENVINATNEGIEETAMDATSTGNIANTGNITNVVKTPDTIQETQTQEETKPTAITVATNDEYFTKSKLERDTMYSQMIETYEKVLNGINSLETQKQTAAEEIKKINDTKNSIMIAENLIATKGFTNNVIFVNGESVSAIIGAEELTQEEISQIQNILSRELKAKIENIHIATK